MPRSSGRLVFTKDKIVKWGDDLVEKVSLELDIASVGMAVAAKAYEKPKSTEHLNESIRRLPVRRTARGFEAGVGAGDFKALWYERGTKAHSLSGKGQRVRSGRTGRAMRSAGGMQSAGFVSGVKGYHYLAKALYSGFPRFLDRLKRRLS